MKLANQPVYLLIVTVHIIMDAHTIKQYTLKKYADNYKQPWIV